MVYSRPRKVGLWASDDSYASFLSSVGFGVGGQSYANLLASTGGFHIGLLLWALLPYIESMSPGLTRNIDRSSYQLSQCPDLPNALN